MCLRGHEEGFVDERPDVLVATQMRRQPAFSRTPTYLQTRSTHMDMRPVYRQQVLLSSRRQPGHTSRSRLMRDPLPYLRPRSEPLLLLFHLLSILRISISMSVRPRSGRRACCGVESVRVVVRVPGSRRPFGGFQQMRGGRGSRRRLRERWII